MAPITSVGSKWAARSAQLALAPLLPGDADGTGFFPQPSPDAGDQPLDLRERTSWTAQVEDVSTVELAEVHCVNSLAPFLLLRSLLPTMRRSPHARRFVVNVAAKEGSFHRGGKQGTHPHTNMAKAALNMMTRTVAGKLAPEGIFVCSVDPGWVSDQRPHHVAEGFVTPLDAVDGAARILDPIFTGVDESAVPLFGVLLKDYRPTDW
jgi:NAD(P)-dependent dehydrogenase (short-subunit alcohol dehydrogenase family)